MKRSKKIGVLTGVLAVACVATWAVMRTEEHKEKIKNSDEIILEIPEDKFTALSWSQDGTKLSFHKEEGDDAVWTYDDDSEFPVSEKKIKDLLSTFEEFGVSFKIEEAEDLAQYGLDQPTCTIDFTADGQDYEVTLGDFSTMDSERYVSIGDGNVYLVKEDPMDKFDAEISDMLARDEIPDLKQADQFAFTGNASYTVDYEKDNKTDTYNSEDTYFTEENGTKKPLDTSSVNKFLGNLANLDLTEYASAHASEEELAEYGLDNPEQVIQVTYTPEEGDQKGQSQTMEIQVSRSAEEKKKNPDPFAKQEDETKQTESKDQTASDDQSQVSEAYAVIDDSGIIYQLTGNDYEKLMKCSYNDLRHQELLSVDYSEISQIDVELEGQTYTITSEKKGNDRTYYYGDEELPSDDLITALKALKSDQFTDEKPAQKEEIRLTIHLDRDDDPTIAIALYRYDGSTCLVEVDGEPVSLVDRSLAMDVVEAVYAIVLK